jgi:hypothetical protein
MKIKTNIYAENKLTHMLKFKQKLKTLRTHKQTQAENYRKGEKGDN